MKLRIGLLVVAVAIVVAGCGHGGASTSPDRNGASKPLSKAEFTNRVESICVQVPPTFNELRQGLRKAGGKISKAELSEKAAIPPLYTAVERMEALSPPPSQDKRLEKIIAALESAAQGLEEEPNSKLVGPKTPFAEFEKLSKKYGFGKCAGL